MTFTMSTTCALFVGNVIGDSRRSRIGCRDGDVPSGRRRGVIGRIPSASGQDVSTICCGRGVPRDRVRRCRVLGPENVAIEEELHTDNANVVGLRWLSR